MTNIEKILKIARRNLNKIVKFEHHWNFRDNDPWIEYIGLIKEIDEKHGYIYIGHPYKTDDNHIVCGEMAGQYSDTFIDICNISPVSEDEFNMWKKLYKEFHTSVLLEKSYDICEENLHKISY